MATIKDIAEKLGISVSTVSKGLNGGKDISEDLRQLVLDTAVELGYTKKKNAKIENRKLGIFIENMDYHTKEEFGYNVLLGFRQAAFKENWQIEVIPVDHAFECNEKYDTYMLKNNFSGSFILGFSTDDPWMEQFQSTTLPTVLLDNFVPVNPNVGYVGTDSDEGINMAIEHLILLGHEKIAFLDGSKDSLISDQRMLAYLNSMASHHLPVDPNLAVYGYFVAESAQYHVPTFLDLGATAILCGNDLIASGVISVCQSLHYDVPSDISVIGFDDIPMASRLEPPLTTIRQDCLEIGKCGYYILKAMTEHVSLSKNLLRPSLVIRSSTATARPRLVNKRLDEKDSVLNINPQLYEKYLKRNQLS